MRTLARKNLLMGMLAIAVLAVAGFLALTKLNPALFIGSITNSGIAPKPAASSPTATAPAAAATGGSCCTVAIALSPTSGTSLQNGVNTLLTFTATAPSGSDISVQSFQFSSAIGSGNPLLTAYRLKNSAGVVLDTFQTPVNVPSVTLRVQQVIARGTSTQFTLEADVSNVNSGDIVKTGLSATSGVTASCVAQGTGGAVNQLISTGGTLTGLFEDGPYDIQIAGSNQNWAASYAFLPHGEPFVLRRLTVINDLSGAFDQPVATGAVTQVTLRVGHTRVPGSHIPYPTIVASAPMVNGVATFTNLNLAVPLPPPGRYDTWVEIYADIASRAAFGEAISGQQFRLGIQDTGNTALTFEAVGANSGISLNSIPFLRGASDVNSALPSVVRRSKPVFAKVNSSTSIINGENTLYAFTVTANAAGPVSFGRLVFDVTPVGLTDPGDDINTFRVLRGATWLSSPQIHIYGADNSGGGTITSLQVANDGMDAILRGNNAGVAQGTYKVIVSFNQEENISAGNSYTYYLKATVSGASTNNSVTTRIAVDDETTAVSGMTAVNNGNTNTTRIYSATAASGLFTAAATDFAQLVSTARTVIWSDKSANSHSYPMVAAYSLRADTGSYDWTNGYLLKLNQLVSQTLTY